MIKCIIAMLLTVTMCAELLAGCGTAVSIVTVRGIETVPVEKTVNPADYTTNIVIRDNGYTHESDQTERLYCVTENTDEGFILGYLREAFDASLLSPGKSIVGAEITLLGADMQPLKDKNGKEIKGYSGRGGMFTFDVSEIAESYQETYYLSIQAAGYYPIEAYEVEYTDLEKYKEQKEAEWGAEGGLIKSAQSLSEFFDKHGVEELYEIVKNHTDEPEKFSEEYKLEKLLANEQEVKAGLAQFANIDFEQFWPMVKDNAITDSWEKIETWLDNRSFTLQAVGLGLMSILRYHNQEKSAELWEKAKDSWQVARFLQYDSQFWEELGAVGKFVGEQVMLDMVLEAAINSRAGVGGAGRSWTGIPVCCG